MTDRIRIVIADDHTLFRQGLQSMLRLEDDMAVVAEAARIADLYALLDRTPCDVLLLDLQMERSCLGDIEALAGRVGSVIVVTASERADDALAAVRAGARGIVFKRFALETLTEAIHAASQGQVWMPPALQARLATLLRLPVTEQLTPREREIVREVALGFRNTEVAQRLFISEVTVKTHLNNIFQKLGVRDRVGLALYAIRVGLIGIDEVQH